ncbi:thiamine diphosphokinase [Tateyamaria sp. SN6-1]|uniref:thiamine diphosphokinase n=1 Tax=Tateyamaria sp. SN6-1 TaxID=3092148 RepID=UPI0039F55122
MTTSIVDKFEAVTLVGGGNASVALLLDTISYAPTCVAADGGVALVLEAGLVPDAVIGDFDSLPQDVRQAVPADRFHHIAEQDSTDFDKALRHITAPLVLAVGFTGARLDHQLAVLYVLTKYPDRPCILISEDELTCLCPPHLTLPTQAGDVVSLFPMGPVTGRSSGLQWPIDGLAFGPLTQIGTSNAATGPVEITVDAPHMLIMLPVAQLPHLIQALVPAPPAGRWPARAAQYKDPPRS